MATNDIVRIAGRQLAAAGGLDDLARRAAGAGRDTDPADGWKQPRTLVFMADRSIGDVVELDVHGAGEDAVIDLALGEVEVDDNTCAGIKLDATDEEAWHCIGALAPGSIQGIDGSGGGAGAHRSPVTRHVARHVALERLVLRDAHVDLAHLRGMTNLRMLRLERCTFEEGSTAAQLAHLDRLTELAIVNCTFDWRGFQPPATLRTFDASHAGIDGDAAARLARCTQLTQLMLDGATITDFGFLAALVVLERIELADTGIDDAGFAYLPCIARLTNVDLSRTKIGNATMRRLAAAQDLVWLLVTGTRITDAGLLNLHLCGALGVLWCSAPGVTGASLQTIGRLQRLVNLNITGIGATDAQMSALDRLAQLRHLHASGNAFTDQLASTCPNLLGRLREAALSETGIGQRVIRALGASACLESLFIQRCSNVTSLTRVLGNGQLKVLDADGCSNLAQFGELDGCIRLETLIASGTAIGARRLRGLGALTALRRLELGGTIASDELLERTISRMPLLERLDLDDTGVSDATLQQLVEHPSLRELRLSNTNVTSAGMVAVATCRRLELLHVRGTLFDNHGLAQLAALTRPVLELSTQAATPMSDIAGLLGALPHARAYGHAASSALDVARRIDEQLGVLGIPPPVAPNPSRLQFLDVRDCDVTVEALLELRRHPNLRAVWIPGPCRDAMPTRHKRGIDGTRAIWWAFR
jgi:hypothetical protein